MFVRQSIAGGMAVAAVLGIAGQAAALPGQSPGVTSRVSVSSTGRQANNDSNGPVISADGRFVTFYSFASNLVPGDTNGAIDVFVRDRLTGLTRRVSVASNGQQGNADSLGEAISANGRYVAFTSFASNLVRDDSNQTNDVFVRDQLTGVTRRVSVASNGRQANGGSGMPAISADGRLVAFASSASNLVPGDTDGTFDVFVRDELTGVARRVSVASNDQHGNADSFAPEISADGRYVTFTSAASNLVSGDSNAVPDVFVRDLLIGATRRVSVGAAGQGNADSGIVDGVIKRAPISADGRFVAFDSAASNLVPEDSNAAEDVFVRDLLAGVTRRVSVSTNGRQGNNVSGDFPPAMSADGRYVAFDSGASNLVPGDTNDTGDVFVRDRLAGVTRRVSVATNGRQGNAGSTSPTITADGRSVAFVSFASNLVPGDTNATDVFVRDPLFGEDARGKFSGN
jgi:Tol biopolymer transport system component